MKSTSPKKSVRVELAGDDWKKLVWLSNTEQLPKSEIIRRATRDAYRRLKRDTDRASTTT